MVKKRNQRFLFVRDDFYEDPGRIAALAKSLTYYEPKDITGYISKEAYCPRYLKYRLERMLGVRITDWDTDPENGNGVFYLGLSSGPHKEVPGVHFDEPEEEITAVIYLTPGLPAHCGTSLWMHKSSGLTDAPTRQDAYRLGKPIARVRDMLERHSDDRSKWIELDRVGYRYNRLVAYRSGMLHSASRHYGRTAADGRLYQAFRVADTRYVRFL